MKQNWKPRAVVALILALSFLVFILAAAVMELVLQGDIADKEANTLAWKEIILALIGGLLVWIGTDTNDSDKD